MTDESEQPPIEEQRQMLTESRAQLRRSGFQCSLEILNLKAQEISGAALLKERERLIVDLQTKANNAYAGAKEMTRLLAELEVASQ